MICAALTQVAAIQSGEDVTDPTLLSATIDATGLVLTLVFSEAVTSPVEGYASFTIDPSGGAAVIEITDAPGSTLGFSINREIAEGETVTLDYTPGDIEDLAGNPLAAITDFPVTNNVPGTFIYLRPGGTDTYLRPGGVDTYLRP
jgi:hypothetical protein